MTKTNVYENKIHVFKNKKHGKLVFVKNEKQKIYAMQNKKYKMKIKWFQVFNFSHVFFPLMQSLQGVNINLNQINGFHLRFDFVDNFVTYQNISCITWFYMVYTTITPHLNVFILHLHLNDFTQHEMI